MLSIDLLLIKTYGAEQVVEHNISVQLFNSIELHISAKITKMTKNPEEEKKCRNG
jgi:hypothetical protein